MAAGDADNVEPRESREFADQFDSVDARSTGHVVPALFQCDGDTHPPIVPVHALPSVGMSGFWKSRSVLVTGGNGFLGRVVVRMLRDRGADVSAPRKADFDLTVPGRAEAMLAVHKPTHVIHLAARVGGIGYNQAAPAPLYLDNLMMGTHVIEACRAVGVEKTVLLGTVCSYPKFTPVPFRESSFWDGYPEETNAPYGIAKKALLIHAQVNAAQYGQRFAYLIPTNLFGPGDKFHPDVSHVIPALIKKCVEAKESGADKVHVWGTGTASREYLYVDDAAEAIVLAAETHDSPEPLNLGTNREITIRETVETIAEVVGYTGDLVWDANKPDGQPRRRVDAGRAEHALGWTARMDFRKGLEATVAWYLAHRDIAEQAP
jgi:GDP-L-fucose synthase